MMTLLEIIVTGYQLVFIFLHIPWTSERADDVVTGHMTWDWLASLFSSYQCEIFPFESNVITTTNSLQTLARSDNRFHQFTNSWSNRINSIGTWWHCWRGVCQLIQKISPVWWIYRLGYGINMENKFIYQKCQVSFTNFYVTIDTNRALLLFVTDFAVLDSQSSYKAIEWFVHPFGLIRIRSWMYL